MVRERRVRTLAAAAVCTAFLGAAAPGGAEPTSQAAVRDDPAKSHWSVIERYCFECHNAEDWAGGVAFDTMTPEHIAQDAEVWEKAVRKLRGGLMPPGSAEQPDRQAVASLVSWLENSLDSADVNPDPGRVPLRRLNRREYANAVRDLLGIPVEVDKLLPADDRHDGFDTIAASLQVSPSFIDQYILAARTVALQAVGNPQARPVTTTYGDINDMVISLPPRGRLGSGTQQLYQDGMPFGTRGGMRVVHVFPADGEYSLTIGDMALAREVPKMEFENTVIALLDGKEFFRTVIGGEEDHKAIDQQQDPAVAAINGRLRDIRFHATAGPHEIAITLLHRTFAESDERTRTLALEGGQERVNAVHAFQIRGPLEVTGVSDDSVSRRKIFICRPQQPSEEEPCARRIIGKLAQRAFRRPVTEEDLEPLMAFYRNGRAEGDFDAGVRDALAAILASPHFLYRAESGNDAGGPRELSDIELASRLSFFLWSSIPDDELLEAAIRNELSDPKVLEAQVRRMLADPRAASLASDFAFQWLNLAKLDEITPDRGIFPHASGRLDPRPMFKEELRLFIDSIFRSDRSVVDLLTADHTFLNERLAMHYGIEGVKGGRFRRVKLDDPVRYGLLGKGAILMLTAYPDRTAPVLRGAWILERIMGTPPAAPPPNVEALPENERGKPARSVRERMAQHRQSPNCLGCHGVMDSLGFALENFDAVGQYRRYDPITGGPVDTSAELPDGTRLEGPEDLRRALASRPDQFVQALTEKLMVYALGRSLDHRDMPTVRRIVRAAAEDGYRFSSIVVQIVFSDAFRKRAAANPGPTLVTHQASNSSRGD